MKRVAAVTKRVTEHARCVVIETSENTHGSNELPPMTARARRVDHRDTAQSPLVRLCD